MSQLRVNTIRHTGASSDAVTLASDGTCTAQITNRSNRNLIINGDCRLDQRGNLSFTNSPHERTYGGPDRFYQYMYASSEEARYDFKRATGPREKGFEYCAHLDVTTADTSIHADHAVWTGYRVEANDCQGLYYGTSDAKSLTLSFWIKSSVTGTYSLRVCSEDWDDYYVTTYTISSADTWEKKTITIPGDQRAGKNITIDSSSGIEIKWIWAAGTNRVGTPNQWATGSTEFGASGITAANIFSSTDNNLYLTGVQLEVGSIATDFEYRPYLDELLRCQRYYWRVAEGGYVMLPKNGYYESHSYPYPVKMRANPDITSNNSWVIRALNSNSNISYSGLNTHIFDSRFYMSSTTTNNNDFHMFIIAADSSNPLKFDAEL